jgi:hypothetical protein
VIAIDEALRKINERRQMVDNKVQRRDIIEEYGNYGSRVYAPKARDGEFFDKESATLKLNISTLNDFNGRDLFISELNNLEESLKTTSIIETKISRPGKETEKTPQSRKVMMYLKTGNAFERAIGTNEPKAARAKAARAFKDAAPQVCNCDRETAAKASNSNNSHSVIIE